ncbi:hypothetical protein HDU86_006994 [Geranomyces michiganensis]|nr:hypothetical protein HDU86_006994 [Geranomyces michiganensis]
MPPRRKDDGRDWGLSSSTVPGAIHPSQAPNPLMVISPLGSKKAARATPLSLQSKENHSLRRETPVASEGDLYMQQRSAVDTRKELGSYIKVSQIKAKTRDDESGTSLPNPATTPERATSAPAGTTNSTQDLAITAGAHPVSAGSLRTLIPVDNLKTSVCNIQDSLKNAEVTFSEIARSHHRLAEWRPTWPDFDGIRRLGTPPLDSVTNMPSPAPIHQETLVPENIASLSEKRLSEAVSSRPQSLSAAVPVPVTTNIRQGGHHQAEELLSGGTPVAEDQAYLGDHPRAPDPVLLTPSMRKASNAIQPQKTAAISKIDVNVDATLPAVIFDECSSEDKYPGAPILGRENCVTSLPVSSTKDNGSTIPADCQPPLMRAQDSGERAVVSPLTDIKSDAEKACRSAVLSGHSRLPSPSAKRAISIGGTIQLLATEATPPKSDQPNVDGGATDSSVLTVTWIHQRPKTARSASASKEHTTQFLIPRVKDCTPAESVSRWPSPSPSTPQPWDDDGDTDEDPPRLAVYEMFPPPLAFLNQGPQPNYELNMPSENLVADVAPRPSTTSVLPRSGRGTSAAFAHVQSKIGKQGEKDALPARCRPSTWSSPGERSAMLRLPLRSQTFEMHGCPPKEVPRPPLRPQSSVTPGLLSRPYSRENVSGSRASRPASKQSKAPPQPPREILSHLIKEAVTKISYRLDALNPRCAAYTPGLWACLEYDSSVNCSPTRHEVSVVDVNQQYNHLVENGTTALRSVTADALADLVWTHRIIAPNDVENADRSMQLKLAKAAESQSQREFLSGSPTSNPDQKMQVSPGAFEWITDSLYIKIPGIFDSSSVPLVRPSTIPPEPVPEENIINSVPETETELSSSCFATNHLPEIDDVAMQARFSLPADSFALEPESDQKTLVAVESLPLPPQYETVDGARAELLPALSQSDATDIAEAKPLPAQSESEATGIKLLHQRPISAWALSTRVPLNSAMRTQVPQSTGSVRAKSASVSTNNGARTTNEPGMKLTETKTRFAESSTPRGRAVSALPLSRQIVPATVAVESTESSSYRPNTASSGSTRPGTRLPSAAPRAITLTAVSHGWQSNDRIASDFADDDDENGAARSRPLTPEIKSTEFEGQLPALMTEGWFVQNVRRDAVPARISESESLLPSIVAPLQDVGATSAPEFESTTCESGAEVCDLSAPRKRKKVKKKHRKSRGRRKRDALKRAPDNFEENATDIFGRSDIVEDPDLDSGHLNSTQPGAALLEVQVAEPVLLPRPARSVDNAMRSILQISYLVGTLQRAMHTHWMQVQHKLYMDMIYVVQRMFRAKRVHLQWVRLRALKRNGRSVTLALRQLERMDEVAHIPANGATTLRDLHQFKERELASPQSSTADLLTYKAGLNPVVNRARCIARKRLRAKDSMARHANLDVDRASVLSDYSATVAKVSAMWPEWLALLKSAGAAGRTIGALLQGEEAYAVAPEVHNHLEAATPPTPLSPLISYSALIPTTSPPSNRPSTTSGSGKSKRNAFKRRAIDKTASSASDKKSKLPPRAVTAPERTDSAKSSRRTSFAQPKAFESRRVSYALPPDGIAGSRRGSSAVTANQSRRNSVFPFTIEETDLSIESIIEALNVV